MENKFKTEQFTLKELEDRMFIIPPYQRPYVWGREQIKKLIDDFYDAFKKDKEKPEEDENYYIGTVLLKKHDTRYQLIDGQQRFITLWLIASAFKLLNKQSERSEIEKFLKVGDELRIDFTIREQIKEYMLSLLDDRNIDDKEIKRDEYLSSIAEAVTVITGEILQCKEEERKGFGDFIFTKVLFVVNTVPENTNMNKLFTTINNSGIQLEQSDILKSKLLKKIKTDRNLYKRVWEACENMNDFFEKNVKQLFKSEFEWGKIGYEALKNFPEKNNPELTNMDSKEKNYEARTINEILSGLNEISDEKKTGANDSPHINDNEDAEIASCRSIISFPQLLLHAYRIFLQDKDDFKLPFHTKRLLEIFEPLYDEDEQTIIKFLKCLWTVRWIFDKEVIKWIQQTDEKDDELFLTNVPNSENSFNRSKIESKSELLMLQCMLYHTGNYNTQIWLTPYLKRLLEEEGSLTCLESIDNELSLRKLSYKEASFELMNKKELSEKEDPESYFDEYFSKLNGTSFHHYWFQKLEYILWKELKKDPTINQEEKFRNYRIISRSSVEHIFSQNPENDDISISSGKMDDFGNLALLNVNQNSSYSNKDVRKKRNEFNIDKKKPYDSLKLVYIYIKGHEFKKNNDEMIDDHREAMIEKIKQHYEK